MIRDVDALVAELDLDRDFVIGDRRRSSTMTADWPFRGVCEAPELYVKHTRWRVKLGSS
jgi:hypothetical protein